jgi:hypothetical protein
VENTVQAEVVFTRSDLADSLDSVQAKALNDKLDNLLADRQVAEGNRVLWLKWQNGNALELHPTLWQEYMRMSYVAVDILATKTKELNSGVVQAPPSTPIQPSLAPRTPGYSPRQQAFAPQQYAPQHLAVPQQQVYPQDMSRYLQLSSVIQPQQPQSWANISANMMPPPPPPPHLVVMQPQPSPPPALGWQQQQQQQQQVGPPPMNQVMLQPQQQQVGPPPMNQVMLQPQQQQVGQRSMYPTASFVNLLDDSSGALEQTNEEDANISGINISGLSDINVSQMSTGAILSRLVDNLDGDSDNKERSLTTPSLPGDEDVTAKTGTDNTPTGDNDEEKVKGDENKGDENKGDENKGDEDKSDEKKGDKDPDNNV